VRALENMIKRFVIRQDEQLVVRELSRPRPTPGAPPAVPVTLPPDYNSVALPAFHSPSSAAPPAAPPAGDAPQAAGAADAPGGGESQVGHRLADIAREASTAAERRAISAALDQVHWNRRKAAQMLGVSYKTLLNKIKDTGIERP
jgi:DNA-binding NtrC family response regulator